VLPAVSQLWDYASFVVSGLHNHFCCNGVYPKKTRPIVFLEFKQPIVFSLINDTISLTRFISNSQYLSSPMQHLRLCSSIWCPLITSYCSSRQQRVQKLQAARRRTERMVRAGDGTMALAGAREEVGVGRRRRAGRGGGRGRRRLGLGLGGLGRGHGGSARVHVPGSADAEGCAGAGVVRRHGHGRRRGGHSLLAPASRILDWITQPSKIPPLFSVAPVGPTCQ